MKIELKHKELGYNVAIATPHNDPDQTFSLKLEDIWLKKELGNAYGYYGHGINLDNISNLDLAIAVKTLPSFTVVNIEPKIKPNLLPKGTIS